MSNDAAAGLRTTVATVPSGASPRARWARESATATASSIVAARAVRARPASRNSRSRVGPLSPIRTAAAAVSPGHARQLGQVDALVAAAGDQHDRRREGPQRRDDRVRLGALGVVDEPDAVDEADRLEPVLDAREGRGGPADRVGGDAEQQPDRDRGQRVGDVVAPRDPQLVDRHDPAARSGLGHATAGERQPLHGRRHDPAVHHAEPAGHGTVVPVQDRRRGAQARVPAHDRVLEVEHERAVRVHELGEAALDPPVGVERAVAVEVVRGDVGVDRDRRAARQRRQLQLGQLDDDAVLRRQLRQALDERRPDVAAQDRRVDRVRGEDRVGQRRRRGLALGPGHADRRGRAQPQEQVGLGDERRDGRVAGRAGGDERLQRRPEARLGRRVVGRDRRRRGDERRVRPRRGRIHVRAQPQGHGPAAEEADRALELRRRAAVVDRHAGAHVVQEAGQRDAAPGQAEHRDRPPVQRPGADVGHGERVEVDRPDGHVRRAH